MQNVKLTTAICLLLALGACSSDQPASTTVSEDTNLLITNAAKHASANIGLNLNSMAAVTNNSTVVATLNKQRKVQSQGSTDKRAKYDDDVRDFLLPTLQGGNATSTRNGNIVSIDPDERHVCQQWLDNNANAVDECSTVLSDLTVQLTATSDDTGTLRYFYAQQNLINIQYAPNRGSYELFLPGFKSIAQRVSDVSGDSTMLPETMVGAVKLSTTIDNDTINEEAGKLSVAITSPLQIASSTGNYNFSLGTSTLFDASTNAATGNAKVSVGVNTFKLAAQHVFGTDENSITTFDMPDFTMNADLNRFGTEVLLTNFGMSRGPFRMAINDIEVLNIALAKFSARFNDLNREIEFLSNFDLSVAFNYSKAAFGWIGDDSTINMSASIPADTLLTEQDNGSTQVTRGGAVNYQYSSVVASGNGENFEQNVLFTSGQCFTESQDSDGYELVDCN